jgi:hypothetical protein
MDFEATPIKIVISAKSGKRILDQRKSRIDSGKKLVNGNKQSLTLSKKCSSRIGLIYISQSFTQTGLAWANMLDGAGTANRVRCQYRPFSGQAKSKS